MDINLISSDIALRARQVKLVLTDCDGVLTDGGIYYSARGEELKRFNIRDGMGVERLWKLAGIETGIITGENSPSVARRAKKLGIIECHLGAKDKAATVGAILESRNLSAGEVAYLGDDVNDLPAFALVGLTSCPGDAFEEVKQVANLVLERPGGHGAFRELAEFILKARTLAVW